SSCDPSLFGSLASLLSCYLFSRLLTLFTSTLFLLMIRPPPISTLFPYTTLFRSILFQGLKNLIDLFGVVRRQRKVIRTTIRKDRSEEHTLNSSHVSISYAVFCLKKKSW